MHFHERTLLTTRSSGYYVRLRKMSGLGQTRGREHFPNSQLLTLPF